MKMRFSKIPYCLLLYAVCTAVTILHVAASAMFPAKYVALFIVLLLLLFAGLCALRLREGVGRRTRVVANIGSLILSIFLGLGNYYLFVTEAALDRLSIADEPGINIEIQETTDTGKTAQNNTVVKENQTSDTKEHRQAFQVFLTGIDSYGEMDTVSRSDVNMIITVNPNTKQILLTSIPRDYYIPQPCQNNQKDKLTHAGLWGVEASMEAVENFFDIQFDYYVRVNFSSVVDIVDALGGITVYSPYAYHTLHEDVDIHVGENELTGIETLGFLRERFAFSEGDVERGRNHMRAIQAMVDKVTSPALLMRYGSIMEAVSGSFQTDMPTEEIKELIKMQLEDMSRWEIRQISVYGKGKSDWSPANGSRSYVMEPDMDSVKEAVKQIEEVKQGGL